MDPSRSDDLISWRGFEEEYLLPEELNDEQRTSQGDGLDSFGSRRDSLDYNSEISGENSETSYVSYYGQTNRPSKLGIYDKQRSLSESELHEESPNRLESFDSTLSAEDIEEEELIELNEDQKEEKQWKKYSSQLKFIFHYGPYEFRGKIAHRKYRMAGLAEKLKRDFGVRVFFKPNDILDRLTIELQGYQVYTCKLTFMKFDDDCSDYCSQVAYVKCKEALNNIRFYMYKQKHPELWDNYYYLIFSKTIDLDYKFGK